MGAHLTTVTRCAQPRDLRDQLRIGRELERLTAPGPDTALRLVPSGSCRARRGTRSDGQTCTGQSPTAEPPGNTVPVSSRVALRRRQGKRRLGGPASRQQAAGSRQQAAGKSPLGVMLMVVHSAVIAVTLSSKGFRRARPRRSTRLRAAPPSIPRIVCSGCRQAKRPVKLAHPAFLLAIATALGLGRESLRHTHSDLEEPGCAHPSADAHRETAHRTLRIGASIRRAFRLRPSSFIHGGERMVSHSPVARARCR